MSALITVHDAGVQHCDLRECNVVMFPRGQPVIIDFDHAEEHHCESTAQIDFHEIQPLRETVKCDELYDLCEQLGVWTPRA